jgi:hypothetical protein
MKKKCINSLSYEYLKIAYERTQLICDPIEFTSRRNRLLNFLAEYILERDEPKETENPSEWIDVAKEEPPKDRPILVQLKNGQQAVMKYENDTERWNTQGWESCIYCGGQSMADVKECSWSGETKVIAFWMELPKKIPCL